MAAKIFRINYKSDFILTLNSDAGWMTPFCIKFWTGAPSQAYFVGFDGTTYTHCAPVDGEPTKLLVQFDDHHLPIGDLKFQIGYHFTVADFPTSVEDEVLNQASVIIEVDDVPAQVMLDLNGETAPEIEFSLPAYANEAQRIANEEQRIANEEQRIANEEARIAAETIRQQNEAQRISNEESRVTEFARLKQESETATSDANAAATLANEKAALADDKAALADAAATLANEKAQLAADKAALAQAAATIANEKAALAQQKAAYAQTQGDYAKAQGDYAKAQGDTAQADHERAEADHTTAATDHQTAAADHTTAASDHSRAEADHTTASSDHTRAESDHTTASSDHTRAESDHTTAASDHTCAESDHTTAAADHTRAESDHTAVEMYVDSLGVFDLSKHNAVGGVLATYADLDAALNALNALDSKYKYGGMSFKFVQSSDNKYLQYRLTNQIWSINTSDWKEIGSAEFSTGEKVSEVGIDNEPSAESDNLVKSGGVAEAIDDVQYAKFDGIQETSVTLNTTTTATGNGSVLFYVPNNIFIYKVGNAYYTLWNNVNRLTNGFYNDDATTPKALTTKIFINTINGLPYSFDGTNFTTIAIASSEDFTNRTTAGDAKIPTVGAILDSSIASSSTMYTCSTLGNVGEKAVVAPNFILKDGSAFKVKFDHENTFFQNGYSIVATQMNVNGTGAKALFLDNIEAAKGNSWEDGEVVDVYYDASTNNGDGAYYATRDASKRRLIHFQFVHNEDGGANPPAQNIGVYLYYANSKTLFFCFAGYNDNQRNFKEIPLDETIEYECNGTSYHYDGENLVPDNDKMIVEGDVDITQQRYCNWVELKSTGIAKNVNNEKCCTLPIRVNHDTALEIAHARCLVVFGYADETSANPVLLSQTASPSSNVFYDLYIRIPDGINYIRMGWYTTCDKAVIRRDFGLDETSFNADILHPLNGEYHTLASAIASVDAPYRKLHSEVSFRTSDNIVEVWEFNGTSIDDWSELWAWTLVDGENHDVKGITANSNVNIYPRTETVDLTRDMYLEFVSTTKQRPVSGQYYLASAIMLGVRFNRANFQFYFRGGAFSIPSGSPELYHHYMLVKNRKEEVVNEATVVNHYLDIYIDGVLAKHENVNNYIDSAIAVPFKDAYINPWYDFLIARAGYYHGDSDGVSSFAASHFNNGNPVAYRTKDDDLFYEILPENMHTDYVVNTANHFRTLLNDGDFTTLSESPYDDILKGSGAPTMIPKYVGQVYVDTDTNDNYKAYGTSLAGDWKKEATMNDVSALKTQTKTINGQSIWGSGDIEGGGSSSGGGNVISVLNYGAVGDGATDDTNAIMQATEAARAGGKALYFPKGVFLTRKSIILTSGMKVTGEAGSILQSANATLEGGGKCVFTTLTANAAKSATTVTVNSVAGLVVGQEIVIWGSGSYTETMADITAINGKVLTIDTSRFTADGQNGGMLNAVSSGGYVLTDFAMIKTIMTKAAENVVVENITIKPMSDITEPHIYTSSPISQTKQTAYAQKNFRVYNVTVLDSANDGISLQGSGESEVVGCRVYNQKHKGIHWGTSHDMIRIERNYVFGCGSQQYENPLDYQGSGAMFFCSNNHRTIIADNFIEDCYKGIYGFNYQGAGEQDTDTIISGNIFKNCTKYGVFMRGGYRAVINGNIFIDFNNTAIPLRTEKEDAFYFAAGVISNNVFGNFGSNFTGPAMQITGSKNLVVNGNNVSGLVSNNATTIRAHCDITVADSQKVVVTSNIVDGTIDVSSGDNVGVVTANNITG